MIDGGTDMTLFDALGLRWDRSAVPTSIPSHSIERVCFRFHKMLPEFVWDASVLEGNPFTFPEVKTLLDGVTIGGHKVSDQEQVLKDVSLGEHGHHTPLPTLPGAPELNRVFREGVSALQACEPFERATAFFLFGALQQFFFDGNKRTSRFMMNGILMSHGIDAISVPAAKAQEFNEKMVRFYLSKDATEMMAFLAGCHPAWIIRD